LIERQRATARYWFDRVAPLDQFAVEPRGETTRMCFTDLTLAYKLRETPTRYAIDTFEYGGKALGQAVLLPATASGRACTAIKLAPGKNGYTIVRLRVQRDKHEMAPVVVHLARDAAGTPRVIGLRRR
jgi:hypothetical protein